MFTKMKKAKQKAKQKAHHYADQILGSSASAEQSPSVSINNTGPKITAAALAPAPDSRPFLAPPASSSWTRPISISQPIPIPPVLSSIGTLPLTRSQPDDLHEEQELSPSCVSEAALIASPGLGRSGRSTAWSGLKTLIGLLNEGANKFGPLKSAFGEILGCIEIFERAAKGREDYGTLRDELDSLFEELSGHLRGPTSPVMTASLKNLAKGIEREIGFVQEKARRNTLGRVAEAMEDVDEIFECYRRIERLLERVSFNANINTWKAVDEQIADRRLDKLSPSQAAQYGSAESTDLRRNACIPNTRIDLLSQLRAWSEDSNSKKIYWLNGMAGTGKTTIAYSLCDQLESSLTLAASFFCSRQLPACRNVNFIIPTVAYQLARFSLPFRHALSNALEQAPDVHTLKVPKQFQKLIVEPLLAVQRTMPSDLVVVIDALDECDSKDGIDQILETLLLHAPGLPIKFFVTSRPEARIQDQMQSGQSRGAPVKLDLHNLEHSVVREDIKTYLQAKLDSPRLTLTGPNLEKLVDQSGVLFIYAATVVRYIAVDNFSRSAKRLAQVLAASASSPRDTSMEIDILYGDILRAALDDKTLNDSERREMKGVLHTIICSQEPLTVNVIAGLLQLDVGSVQAALRPLNSVLHLSSEVNGVVTTFHESFPDYMFDKSRSGPFCCDAQNHNTLLARQCFNLIGAHDPPFNICNLESSYVFDQDVLELDRRIKGAISDEMFYACQYWGPHLVLAEPSPNHLGTLRDFLSVQLLLWMEVMNLEQRMSTGVRALYQVQTWLQGISSSDDVWELALDAWRFALEFSTSPMSRSTPHIYVSALSFWPDHRPVSRYYYPKMQGMSNVTGTAMERRKSAPLAACATRSSVRSVAYSFDGTRIVSGLSDGTLQIWDAYTGQTIGQPLEGHAGPVLSVAYLHDGTRIVSGSDDHTIRIWDAHTSQGVGEPLKGHTAPVLSVAYSHDGIRIVSGSSDTTIRIWDARSGQTVGEALEGHTDWIRSVAYSPDNKHIASGSDDHTTRIWDAHTVQQAGEPLQGHTDWVRSVAYSPNGTHIVSGSSDKHIRIWDAHTGQSVGKPLEGHVGSVLSVAYSHDGTRIISGSNDETARIWDAHTGQTVGEPLDGFTGSVYSVAYSHDGTRIVSGSHDNTIRIWDAHTSQMVAEPLDGHAESVRSLAYSPDGKHIVSGSDDQTIRIWDAHTGQMVGEALKGHTGFVFSVVYAPHGTRLVSGSDDHTIRIWDAHTHQIVGEPLIGHTDSIRSVSYSRDGTRIVSGSWDNTIRIWDACTGQPVGEPLQAHTGPVTSVAYSHDSTRIVSGSNDRTAQIWDAHTGQTVGQPLEGHTGSVYSVAYSHDCTRVVSGSDDCTIRIWDAHTGRTIGQPLEGHTSSVYSVAYSYNSTYIISGSADKTVRIWDAHTGQMVGEPLYGHTDWVRSVAYSPDNTRIISSSDDKTVRIWDADVHSALTQDARQTTSQGQLASVALAFNPVLSNSSTANPHVNWTLDKDGWALGAHSRLLIWVPLDVRGLLLRPRALAIISARGSLALDFSNAHLGEKWHACYCFKATLPA